MSHINRLGTCIDRKQQKGGSRYAAIMKLYKGQAKTRTSRQFFCLHLLLTFSNLVFILKREPKKDQERHKTVNVKITGGKIKGERL